MVVRRTRRPLADKVLKKFERHSRNKVVNLKSFKTGKQLAQTLSQTVTSDTELAKLHPAHAHYVYAQNRLAVMAEQLTCLPELDRLSRILAGLEDEYMPSGPPMSPLTSSFYTCWTLFDISVGNANETLCSTAIAVGQKFGMHENLLHLLSLMQESYTAVYRHEGVEGDYVLLRELVTDRVFQTVSTSGYLGQKGELWYVRLMPPPSSEFEQHVVFTTPYRLLVPSEKEWLAYFDRVLPPVSSPKRISEYQKHMKYGPPRNYWSEFVFEAYVNYQHDVIFLEGLPDIEESRPCSRVNLQ